MAGDLMMPCGAETQLLIGDEVLSTFSCNLLVEHNENAESFHESYDEDGVLLASWQTGTEFRFGIDEENNDEVG
jgi:hypothetical protein